MKAFSNEIESGVYRPDCDTTAKKIVVFEINFILKMFIEINLI